MTLWNRLTVLVVSLVFVGCAKPDYAQSVCDNDNAGGGISEDRHLRLVFNTNTPLAYRAAMMEAANSWYPAIRSVSAEEANPNESHDGGLYVTTCTALPKHNGAMDYAVAFSARGSGIGIVSNTMSQDDAVYVFAHELGHHLGLYNDAGDGYDTHAQSRDSVMFHSPSVMPSEDDIGLALSSTPWLRLPTPDSSDGANTHEVYDGKICQGV